MNDCGLGLIGVGAIGDSLRVGFGDECRDAALSGCCLQANSALTELDLHNNDIGDEGVQLLAPGLKVRTL